jgi:Mg-chelatase subunit ChlD
MIALAAPLTKMRTTPLLVMLFSLAAAAQHYHGIRALTKRDVMKACSNLVIKSNNGDRKVAIVVDSSSSMRGSDPDNLRLSAARALNDFLISSSEAEGDKKADQVVVVGFESNPYNVFGPGDPGDPAANAAINRINSTGGTTIASGVLMATEYIEAMAGITKDRSAIVVFTDGLVSQELA